MPLRIPHRDDRPCDIAKYYNNVYLFILYVPFFPSAEYVLSSPPSGWSLYFRHSCMCNWIIKCIYRVFCHLCGCDESNIKLHFVSHSLHFTVLFRFLSGWSSMFHITFEWRRCEQRHWHHIVTVSWWYIITATSTTWSYRTAAAT